MKTAIDNLVVYLFGFSEKAQGYQILLYRTRLNKTPEECSEIFGLSSPMINLICKRVMKSDDKIFDNLNRELDKQFPKYLVRTHKEHLMHIQKRLTKKNTNV